MAVRKLRNSWWVDFRINHTRYRKRSPENSRNGAQAYEAQLRHRLALGETIDTPPAAQSQLLGPFARQWYDTYVVANNKAGERENKHAALFRCIVPFFGHMQICSIKAYHIEQYKAHLQKRGKSPKTINNRLNVLSTCLNMAYEWLEIRSAPPKIARLKCPPPKTDYLSLDECGLLLSHATGVLREMLLTALRTGMRRGEIIGLQWSSIDWQTQTIIVQHSFCEYTKELSTTKSNRSRHIPIDAEVYGALFSKRRDTGYVFVDRYRRRFTGKQLSLQLKRLCKAVGLRNVGWHALRHTFASHLAMKGVPLNSVQALLGHSAITTTMRYAHVAPSTLRFAINMLNPKTGGSSGFGQPVGNAWIESLERDTKDPFPTT